LQYFDEKGLMWIADGLTSNSPTLGGVLGPVTGVGDARSDPENQKRPMSQDCQGFHNG
jgi:hypothetical protein